MVYLDNAATTAVAPEVAKKIYEVLQQDYGNPSSTYRLGRRSKQLLTEARQVMAHSIGAKLSEVVITGSGSESNNHALRGVAHAATHGRHIISTTVEHPSVAKTLHYLAQQGYEVTYIPVDQTGRVAVADVQAALRPDTILVSVMFVNNEVGSIMPIAEIGRLLADHPAVFHVDAVQAFGMLPIDVQRLHVDLLSVSAHKVHGPKGIGFLYCRSGVTCAPLIRGGSQENNRRASTENVAYAVGFAEAIRLKMARLDQDVAQLRALRTYLLEQLDACGISYQWNVGQEAPEAVAPHIMNLWVHGMEARKLLIQLDLLDVFVSAGSACSAGAVTPSPVLSALYDDATRIAESLRISLSAATTQADLDAFVTALVHIHDRQQQVT